MNEKYGDDVLVIGVAGRGTETDMARFVEDGGVGAFQHAVDDDDATVWKAFDVSSQPAFVFLNDDGTFETVRGALSGDEVAKRIEALKAS